MLKRNYTFFEMKCTNNLYFYKKSLDFKLLVELRITLHLIPPPLLTELDPLLRLSAVAKAMSVSCCWFLISFTLQDYMIAGVVVDEALFQ